jgi:hypothetical protein
MEATKLAWPPKTKAPPPDTCAALDLYRPGPLRQGKPDPTRPLSNATIEEVK